MLLSTVAVDFAGSSEVASELCAIVISPPTLPAGTVAFPATTLPAAVVLAPVVAPPLVEGAAVGALAEPGAAVAAPLAPAVGVAAVPPPHAARSAPTAAEPPTAASARSIWRRESVPRR